MGKLFGNQRGLAIVYGLIVLMIASVAGTAVLFMTRVNRMNATNYGQMRVVTQAAQASLKACEGQFGKNPATAIDLFKKYLGDNSYKWLFGTADEADNEHRITLGDHEGAPEYSARITGFDENTGLLKVEGIGYGRYGGKKKVVAVYQLAGLAMVAPPAALDPGCLYLAGGLNNCDDPLIVNGNAFVGSSNMINSNGGLTVNGYLKTGTGGFNSNGLVTLNGNAFIRGAVQFQGSAANSTFNGDVGFKQDLSLISMNINVHGNFFINGNDGGSGSVLINGGSYTATYYTGGGYDPARITATSPATKQAATSPIDLAAALNLDDADDPAPSIVGNLEALITSSGGTIYTPSSAGLDFNTTGWNLSSAYSSKSKWNGFLVIKTTTQMWMNQSGGTFNGKVIWIIDCPWGFEARNWYCSGPNSNTLIYIKNTCYLDNFGESMVGSPPLVRGIIFNASTASNIPTYKFQSGTTIEGAVIHVGTAGVQFNSNSGGATINYNSDVIDEFVNLGILTMPAGGGTTESGTPELTLIDLKIRPRLLAVQL